MRSLILAFLFFASCANSVIAQPDPGAPLREWRPRDTPARQWTERDARRMVAPGIRAATDCIAAEALQDPFVVDAYRLGNWHPIINSASTKCFALVSAMISQHDQYFYRGKGSEFYNGAYLQDLPRAIITRIKPQLESKIGAVEQLERQRQAEIARAEAEQSERIKLLEKTRDTLRDRFYDCAERELRKLTASNESAEVLTSAALTICRREASDVVQAALETLRAKSGSNPDAETQLQTVIAKTLRENVIASAVRAKAEANANAQKPSPMLTPNANASPPVQTPNANTTPSVAKEMDALRKCLLTMSSIQQNKIGSPDEISRNMLELCRPEIEALARMKFLTETQKSLDQARAEALETAQTEAKRLASTTGPPV